MKKVLFVTLALAVGMTGFAQTKNMPVKAEKGKVGTANIYKKAIKGNEPAAMEFSVTPSAPMNQSRENEFAYDVQTMKTYYDLQSNGFVANRMHRFDDGTVGLVATWSQQSNLSDRGAGYDYYNGSAFIYDEENNPMPGRIENEKTGWPCYTQYGPDGEIVISHAAFGTSNAHLCYYTREKKGEGEWQGPFTIPNPEDLGTTVNLMTWPKIATSGPNHDIIHLWLRLLLVGRQRQQCGYPALRRYHEPRLCDQVDRQRRDLGTNQVLGQPLRRPRLGNRPELALRRRQSDVRP